MNYYFSFGFGNTHAIEGVTYDRTCLVMVKTPEIIDSPESRAKARKTFTQWLGNNEWSFQRNESEYKSIDHRRFFPRGVIKELP